VAGFIGSPAMNFASAKLVRDDGLAVTFAGYRLPVTDALLEARPGLADYIGKDLIVGIRPSDFEDADLADAAWPRLDVRSSVTEELGSDIHVIFEIDAPPVQHASISDARAGAENDDEAIPLAVDKTLWTARVAPRSKIRPGSAATLAVDTSNLQFFDSASGLAIGRPSAG
jgi:multiple sugar transport system ATP-binding protein